MILMDPYCRIGWELSPCPWPYPRRARLGFPTAGHGRAARRRPPTPASSPGPPVREGAARISAGAGKPLDSRTSRRTRDLRRRPGPALRPVPTQCPPGVAVRPLLSWRQIEGMDVEGACRFWFPHWTRMVQREEK
jgi:hypothetical protein